MTDKTLVERLRMTGKEIQGPCPDGIDGCLVLHPMINTDPLCKEAADTIEAQATHIEALEAALRRMIYETTHLSPMKPNGDHDCTIKADALEQARQALEGKSNG